MIFSQLKEFKTWDFDIENWEFASFWWLTQVYTRPIFLIQNNEIYRELTLYYSLYTYIVISWLIQQNENSWPLMRKKCSCDRKKLLQILGR